MKPRSLIRSLSRDRDKVTSLLSKNCLSYFTGVSSQALVITPKFTFYNMAPAIENALKMFPYKWKFKFVVFSIQGDNNCVDGWDFEPKEPMRHHHLAAVAMQYCLPLIKEEIPIDSIYAVGWVASLRSVEMDEIYEQGSHSGIWKFNEPMVACDDGKAFFDM